MVNVHLNGELVRCPDMSTIQERAKRIRAKNHICSNGIYQFDCPRWKEFCKEHSQDPTKNKWCQTSYIKMLSAPCFLNKPLPQKYLHEDHKNEKINLCPRHKNRVETGKMEKTFAIDSKVYRKLTSAAHYMVKNSAFKTIFFTLTFPPFKRETNEKECNERFSRFMENLHNTYDVKYYLAVREYGDKTFNIHYHCLVAIKYVSFAQLNDAWCHAIQDLCYYSRNAFTTRRKSVILREPGAALRYICGYISKARGTKSKSRIVFLSTPLVLKPYKRRGNDSLELLHAIRERYKSVYINPLEHCTIFRITDPAEFDDFCNIYLYDLFGIGSGKTDFLSYSSEIGK